MAPDASSWPLHKRACIVSEFNGLVAVEKPIDVLSHPNKAKANPLALLQAPYDFKQQAYQLDGSRSVHVLHRLDAGASGLLLLSEVEHVADSIRTAFRNRKIQKTYFAAVFGTGNKTMKGHWRDGISKQRGSSGAFVRASQGTHEATCTYRWICGDKLKAGVSLLQLRPQTGRTHQLRFQCTKHGWPIVGDGVYGAFARNRAFGRQTGMRRLFLHAACLSFALPNFFGGSEWVARSPLGSDFERLFGSASLEACLKSFCEF